MLCIYMLCIYKVYICYVTYRLKVNKVTQAKDSQAVVVATCIVPVLLVGLL